MASKKLNSDDTNGLTFSTGGNLVERELIWIWQLFKGGCHTRLTGSSISTLAASTRDESTSSPEQNQMRTDSQRPPEVSAAITNLTSRFSPDRKDAMEIQAICPLEDTPPTDAPPTLRGPPLSADLLSERHRRSKSEEG